MGSALFTGLSAALAQRQVGVAAAAMAESVQRLSSGLRINGAKDDAAGLAIASRMTSQVNGLNRSARNANDGISMAQTAEGALRNMSDALQRIRELAVQSANATNSADDRKALNAEVNQLVAELDRLATQTEFNGQRLLDGTLGTALFQVGANAGQTVALSTPSLQPQTFGLHQSRLSFGFGANPVVNQPWGVNGVTAGTLEVSGHQGTAQLAIAANDSAQTIAAKVNAQVEATGVQAQAEASLRFGAFSSGTYVLTLRSSNSAAETITIDIPASATTDVQRNAVVVQAFNAVSHITGVTAAAEFIGGAGDRVFLRNTSGLDIVVGDTAYNNPATLAVLKVLKVDGVESWGGAIDNLTSNSLENNITVSGYLTLSSVQAFRAAGSVTNAVSATPASSQLLAVSSMDVGTVSGAHRTLRIADAAMAHVNAQRARLGAVQARFETAVAALGVTTENLSEARSRVEDADFATETAALSRTQILQQATTAMVAQANQLERRVLDLLR